MRSLLISLCFVSFGVFGVDDYSVNLMWIDFDEKPFATQFMSNENIDRVRAWRAKTGHDADVTVWYDGFHTIKAALSTTQEIFSQDTAINTQLAKVRVQNIRELPEVMANPEVFSNKTPGFFRADLLRLIAAYNVLAKDPKMVFVYSDLDVTAMTKIELFDEETKHNLREIGLVLARGGMKGFENSFQITAYKENLQQAMKVAIDVSITRAKNILSGGSWADEKDGDTKPLTQTLYDTFDSNLLPYFYFLEGLLTLNITPPKGMSLSDYLASPAGQQEFGTDRIISLSYAKMDPKIVDKSEKFDYSGESYSYSKMKIPTKIIEAPPSQFGGQPEKYDPNKITPDSYEEKLKRAAKEDLPKFLFLAARNNYFDMVPQIAEKFTPEEFTDAILEKIDRYTLDPEATAFNGALASGSIKVLRQMIEKISSNQQLLDRVADAMLKPNDGLGTILKQTPKEKILVISTFLADTFLNHPQLMFEVGIKILDSEVQHYDLFFKIVDRNPSVLTERRNNGETAAIMAARRGHLRILKEIFKREPDTFKIKNYDGIFPLLFPMNLSPNFFKEVWAALPSVRRETDRGANNIAHYLAREDELLSMLQFVIKEAPDLFRMRNRSGETPAVSAASALSAKNLDAIITAFPDVAAWSFAEILKQSAKDYDCLKVLAKHFKDKIEDIVATATSFDYERYTDEQIAALRNL